jgi:6-phosphogluconolactonase
LTAKQFFRNRSAGVLAGFACPIEKPFASEVDVEFDCERLKLHYLARMIAKITAVLVMISAMATGIQGAKAKEAKVYFGTYTSGESKGIYSAQFDSATGKLSKPQLVAETKNPSFLAVHPNGTWFYAVSETGDAQGKPTGGVGAFSINPDGSLYLLNKQPSGGAGPCHVALDRTGKCVLVATYGSGSVSALGLDADGRLLPGSTIQHRGSSVDPKRQTGPHAHQAVTSPDNRFALFCDLGLDKVIIYKLDAKNARLEPNDPPSASLKPGAGPRHLEFRPDGKFLYVINELDSTMSVFKWNARRGECTHVQTLSTLPESFEGTSYCAELVFHPNGKFLFGSNRGHDGIVAFSVNAKDGTLKTIDYTSSGGKFPRFIGLDPSGKWLISLNQNSNNGIVLKVDSKAGKLEGPVHEFELGSPVCAVFSVSR